MQASPISIIIRSNSTHEYRETSGLLYITKQGEHVFYTAIVESENISAAPPQLLDDEVSPLQLILAQQAKTRQKAEKIADKIIEEIILQRQRHVVSATSLETTPMSRSNSQVQISSYVQRKNELLMKISSQIERSISDEQENGRNRRFNSNDALTHHVNALALQQTQPQQMMHQPSSFDNISQASRPSIRLGGNSGSLQLNVMRSINKSRNQLSPPIRQSGLDFHQQQLQLNRDYDERVETEVSQLSGRISAKQAGAMNVPLLNLMPVGAAGAADFDLKEYMKQAIMSQTKIKQQQHITETSENTPAFHQAKRYTDDDHSRVSAPSDFNNGIVSAATASAVYLDIHSAHMKNEEPENNHGRVYTEKSDNMTTAKQSHFKSMPRKGSIQLNESQGEDQMKRTSKASSVVPTKKQALLHNNLGEEGGTINIDGEDFISKINKMLQRSANINAQVEQSLMESERNLNQIDQSSLSQPR